MTILGKYQRLIEKHFRDGLNSTRDSNNASKKERQLVTSIFKGEQWLMISGMTTGLAGQVRTVDGYVGMT